MTFSKFVSPATAHRATFNYHEQSYSVDKDGREFRVYHTKHPTNPEPNLVIVESRDDPEEFYFRAFLGKHSGECDTDEEVEEFMGRVRHTINPQFRVPAGELENRLARFLNMVENSEFFNPKSDEEKAKIKDANERRAAWLLGYFKPRDDWYGEYGPQ